MEWIKIFISALGLSTTIYIFKIIFSKRFRESLRKNDFKSIKEETDEFIKYIKENNQIIQLQNATNQYLGTNKFHYSLIINNFQNHWNYRNLIKDLQFSFFYIEQKIIDNNAELYYKYSIKTLKRIEKYNIILCACAAFLYVLVIFFERFLIPHILLKYNFDINIFNYIKLTLLIITFILIPLTVFFGSKATIALSLQDTFKIKEKSKL